MIDKNGRKVIFYDKTKDVAIIEDLNSYLIVCRLSINEDILCFEELIKYSKSLDYARFVVSYDLLEV